MNEKLNAADTAALSNILHFISNLSAEDKKNLSAMFEGAQKKLTPAKKLFKPPVVNFSIHRDINDQLADMQTKINAGETPAPSTATETVPKRAGEKENQKMEDKKANDKHNEYEFIASFPSTIDANTRNFNSLYQAISDIKNEGLKNTFLKTTLLGRALKTLFIDSPIAFSFQTMNHEYGHKNIADKYDNKANPIIDGYDPIFGITTHWSETSGDIMGFFRATGLPGVIGNRDPMYPDFPYIGKNDLNNAFNDYNVKESAAGMQADLKNEKYQLEKAHLRGKINTEQSLAFLATRGYDAWYVLGTSHTYNYLGDSYSGYLAADKQKSIGDPDCYAYALYHKNYDNYYNKYWQWGPQITSDPALAQWCIDNGYLKPARYSGPTFEQIQDQLKLGVAVSLASPQFWNSVKNLYNGIAKGEEEFSMPKRFFDTNFVPGPNGVIFGADYYTQTAKKQYPQVVSAWACPMGNYGSGDFGAGIKTFHKDKKGNFAGYVKADAWMQDGNLGGNIELERKIQLSNALKLILGIGYKTKGFCLGLPDESGFYGGIGATLRF